MRKEVSEIELKKKLNEYLNGVYLNGDRLIVQHADKPLAAIVPIQVYDRLLKQRGKVFSVLDRIWENVPKISEEEVQDDIEQAIAEARAENSRKKSETSR